MKSKLKWGYCILLLCIAQIAVYAQEPQVDIFQNEEPDLFDFPDLGASLIINITEYQTEIQYEQNYSNSLHWLKGARRAEIIFFGSFPFSLFFSRMVIGLYRSASNNWDQRYAPWPFASAGAIPMNNNELRITIAAAISVSLAVSIADYLIVSRKRKTAANQE